MDGRWSLVIKIVISGKLTRKGRAIIKRWEGYQFFKQGSQKIVTLPLNTNKKIVTLPQPLVKKIVTLPTSILSYFLKHYCPELNCPVRKTPVIHWCTVCFILLLKQQKHIFAYLPVCQSWKVVKHLLLLN